MTGLNTSAGSLLAVAAPRAAPTTAATTIGIAVRTSGGALRA